MKSQIVLNHNNKSEIKTDFVSSVCVIGLLFIFLSIVLFPSFLYMN